MEIFRLAMLLTLATLLYLTGVTSGRKDATPEKDIGTDRMVCDDLRNSSDDLTERVKPHDSETR